MSALCNGSASSIPNSYEQYWQYITVPATGGEVHIDASGLDPKVFVQLMQLQFEHYHPV